jgi:hypothetical protein
VSRARITLQGTLTYAAFRTFDIDVPDDVNMQLLHIDTLADLADAARVAWSFGETGHLDAVAHTVELLTDAAIIVEAST